MRAPPRDRAGATPCILIVGDAGEMSAKLDGRRELAALLISATDSLGYFFRNHEHGMNINDMAANANEFSAPLCL